MINNSQMRTNSNNTKTCNTYTEFCESGETQRGLQGAAQSFVEEVPVHIIAELKVDGDWQIFDEKKTDGSIGQEINLTSSVNIPAAPSFPKEVSARPATPAGSENCHPLHAFATQGFKFVLVQAQSKKPIKREWPNADETMERVEAHLRHGGNIGVITGKRSQNRVAIDVDGRFTEFCCRFPQVKETWQVVRANALDRGKLFIEVLGEVPPSQNWKQEGHDKPDIELLSDGRQAVIPPSIHPSGVSYELKNGDKPIVKFSVEELARMWKEWTGKELRLNKEEEPTQPIKSDEDLRDEINERATQKVLSNYVKKVWVAKDDFVAEIKSYWASAEQVFAYHGISGPHKREGQQIRIKGHSGLVFKRHQPELWYWFSEGVGGDQIDAWGYCKFGHSWDHHNVLLFKQVLEEMAQAGGIEISKVTREEVAKVNVKAIIEKAKDYAVVHNWENNRTHSTDRRVLNGVLNIMEEYHKLQVPVGSHKLASEVNLSAPTVAKALTRLVEYKILQLIQDTDGLQARVYTLSEDIKRTLTLPHPEGGRVMCKGTLHNLETNDTFIWGAKLHPFRAKTQESHDTIGPTALEIIASLRKQDIQSIHELASHTGVHPGTVGKKVKILLSLGIVETAKVGRTIIVALVKQWNLIIAGLWDRMTTYGKHQKRIVKYFQTRLSYYQASILLALEQSRYKFFSQKFLERIAKMAQRIPYLQSRLSWEVAVLQKMMAAA